MPRVSRERTEENRRAITEASARLIRERGITGLSVSDLMAAVGLTHGGFYGHFASKDDLAAQACAHALDQSAVRWRKRASGRSSPAEALKALVDLYLSAASRDNPGDSCAVAALAGDVAREAPDAPVRTAYLNGVRELIDILSSVGMSKKPAQDRKLALGQFSTLVGALLLARATSGDAVSDEFLKAAREMLLPVTTPAVAP